MHPALSPHRFISINLISLSHCLWPSFGRCFFPPLVYTAVSMVRLFLTTVIIKITSNVTLLSCHSSEVCQAHFLSSDLVALKLPCCCTCHSLSASMPNFSANLMLLSSVTVSRGLYFSISAPIPCDGTKSALKTAESAESAETWNTVCNMTSSQCGPSSSLRCPLHSYVATQIEMTTNHIIN